MIAVKFKDMLNKFFGSMSLSIILKFKSILILFFIYPFFNKAQLGVYSVALIISGLLSPLLLMNLMDGSNKFFLKNKSYSKKLELFIKQYTTTAILILLIIFLLLVFFGNIQNNLLYITFYLIFYRMLLKSLIYKYEIFQNLYYTFIINLFIEFGSLAIILLYIKNFSDLSIQIIPISLLSLTLIISLIKFRNIYEFSLINFIQSWKLFIEPIKVSLNLLPVPYILLLVKSTDVILLNLIIGFESNGIYHIANSIALLVAIFSTALNYFWYSTASLAKPNLIKKILDKSIVIFILTLFPIFFIFIFFGKIIFSLFYSFEAVILTGFLSISYFTLFFTQMFHGYFYSISKYNLIIHASVITFLFNIILSYFLINRFGINGAGIGTFLSYSLGYCYCLVMFFELKKNK